MPNRNRVHHIPFVIIDRNQLQANWNGLPVVLQINDGITMAQTPNGTLVLSWMNQAVQNNAGDLAVTSGGSAPLFLDAPALANRPSVLLNNWRANNLSITNISPAMETPILVQAFGPGVEGQLPVPLHIGSEVPLVTAQSAQGTTNPQFMQLVMRANSPSLTVFCVIGGPPDGSGNNGYVFSVNDSENTGGDSGKTPPHGYTATTTSNTYTFQFNWKGASIYVVNMSAITATNGQVLLRAL